MARALPEVARYRVIFADCDPMRIVYYGNYFRLFEIGRCELFRGMGHPFREYVEQGRYLAVLDAACRYKRPARYDDEVTIHAGVLEVGGARITLGYAVMRDGELLVEGETTHAVVDDSGRPQRLPTDFRDMARAARIADAHEPQS